ncbi:MAG TPA: AsmA family protein, partial [Saprospiraceae bacterium]|nr:AsmA family protein [Saprospiraceae bacterium]
MRKKLIYIFVFLLLLPLVFFGGTCMYIHYNKGSIYQRVIQDINKTYEGEIKIDHISLAPFRNFPYTSIDLKNTRFYESKDTTCLPLYRFQDIYVGFDLLAAWQGKYEIKKISFEEGKIDITKYKDGSYNILKAKNISENEDSAKTTVHLDLDKINIKNVDIKYLDLREDRAIDLYCKSLTSKIRLRNEHYYLDLESDCITTLIEKQKPTFFINKSIYTDIELDYDSSSKVLNILPGKIQLNEAIFKIEGNIDIQNDMDMDIKIKGDKPDFNIIAAFLPNDVGKALTSYRNEGKIFFDGTIQGKAIHDQVPSITVYFGCDQAYFLNQNVNKKVDQLRFNGKFTNGDARDLKSSQLQINNFHARPEQGLFVGHLLINNFVDPLVKLDVHA